MSAGLTIGMLARETGTKVETIRWYEKVGLLSPPARTSGNYRAYSQSDLSRLGFIRRARELGFSLDSIRELLTLSDNPGQSCDLIDGIARVHLAEVDRALADLSTLRGELSRIVESCSRGTVADCKIIETLTARS